MTRLVALIILAAVAAHAVPMGARAVASTSGGATARDYIQDGLVAMWDGIENAGWGVHSSTTTTWKDLVGRWDLPRAVGSTRPFGDNCMICDGATRLGANFGTTAADYPAYKYYEIVLSFDDFSATRGYFSCGYTSVKKDLQAYSNTGTFSPSVNRSASGYRVAVTGLATNTVYAFYQRVDGRSPAVFKLNGENAVVSGSQISDVSNRGIYVGSVYSNFAKGKIYAIRVYNRVLTAEEIAHNYAVDKARFGLP